MKHRHLSLMALKIARFACSIRVLYFVIIMFSVKVVNKKFITGKPNHNVLDIVIQRSAGDEMNEPAFRPPPRDNWQAG